jgi:TatD DNase family protein
MLDIHAHLYWESYDADRDEMIRRAFDAGIEKMICVGTEPGDNPKAVAVVERYEGIYAAIGIHPHFFNEYIKKESPIIKIQETNNHQLPITNFQNKFENQSEEKTGSRVRPGMTEWMVELRELAKHPKVVAIGECGLDYYVRQSTDSSQQTTITEEQKMIQREGFLAQIEIASELGLPLIIHTRPSAGTMDAYEDVFEILTYNLRHTTNNSPTPQFRGLNSSPRAGERELKTNGSVKNPLSLISYPLSSAILHCYQGDTEITKKFLELPNVYFSFAGNITYPMKKAFIGTESDLAEVVKLVPLSRLFVETDAPFLAPVPHRGDRNEPAFAIATAEKICELKGCSREELDRVFRAGFRAVFTKAGK